MTKFRVNDIIKKRRMPSFKCIFDWEKGTLIGRTAKSWGQILLYYVAFYSSLVGLFALMLTFFIQVMIKSDAPYRTGIESLLALAPGIALAPKLPLGSSTLIISTNQSSPLFHSYIASRSKYLDETFNNTGSSRISCDFNSNKRSSEDIQKSCAFDRTVLGPCNDPKTALSKGIACVYLKINRVFGYFPDIENSSFSEDILIKCETTNKGEKGLIGEVEFFPSVTASDGKKYGKYSHAFFPFLNQPDFQSSIVAVHFPTIRKDKPLKISCKLFNLKTPSAAVPMELMITS